MDLEDVIPLANKDKQSLPLINSNKTVSKNVDTLPPGTKIKDIITSFQNETVIDLRSSRKSTVPFDPLDEEGERYLRENMTLPPIGTVPSTKYYINIHPSESDMSSSVNSVSEWWDYLDYDDIEDGRVDDARKQGVVEEQPVNLPRRTEFPLTEHTIKERKRREKLDQEMGRDQVIHHLEKQMVSLFKLKQQYQKTTGKKGCTAEGVTAGKLPALGMSDRLNRHRDSIVDRVRRRMKEEEIRKKNQIERKISIVTKLLREQRGMELESEKILPVNLKIRDLTKSSRPTSFKKSKMLKILDTEMLEQTLSTEDSSKSLILRTMDDDNTGEKKITETHCIPSSRKESTSNQEKREDALFVDNAHKALSETATAAAISEKLVEPPIIPLRDQKMRFENWRENDNHVRCLSERVQYLPEETCIEVKPSEIIFKDLQPRQYVRKDMTITNVGQDPLQCRVAGITSHPTCGNSPLLQVQLDGPSKARTGTSWTLSLTVECLRELEDTIAEVHLLLCRDDDSRSRRTVKVVMLTPCAEPTLSTPYIRFEPHVFWGCPVTKTLQVLNTGGRGCVMRWELVASSFSSTGTSWPEKSMDSSKQIDDHEESIETLPPKEESSRDSTLDARQVAEEMLSTVLTNVWNVFRVNGWQNQVVPPNSQTTLPVTFVPSMSSDKGDVFAKYVFTFQDCGRHETKQELLVCGIIKDSPLTVKPSVLDMGVCFADGGPQQTVMTVTSDLRHVCGLRVGIPSQLARWVTVLPAQAIVQAHSATDLAVRFTPSTRILEGDWPFLDHLCGLLSFPIKLSMVAIGWQPPPPVEVTVFATVLPLCPLTISPSSLDLGHLSTFETVRAEFYLVNHQSYPYTYAFLNLPQRVQIEPGGGCGTIMGNEVLRLCLLYSGKAEDIGVKCGRPGGEGEVILTLRCFTSISMAAPKPIKRSIGNVQKSKYNKKMDLKTMDNDIKYSNTTNFNDDKFIKDAGNLNTIQDEFLSMEMDESANRLSLNAEYNYSEHGLVDKGNETEGTLYNTSTSVTDGVSQILSSEAEGLWDYYSKYQLNSGRTDVGDIVEEECLSDEMEEEYEKTKEVVPEESTLVDSSDLEQDQGTGEGDYLKLADNEIKDIPSDTEMEGSKVAPQINSADLQEVKKSEEKKLGVPPPLDQHYATLKVTAHLVDPLVELSSQVVILPPTPRNSQAIAHVYLRSRLQNQCQMHKKNSKFKTWFEFKSDCKNLTVEPRRGCLQYKQSIKISIIFQPTLKYKEIYEKAVETKIETIKWNKIQEMLDQYYKAQEKKKKKALKRKKSAENLTNGSYAGDPHDKNNKASESRSEDIYSKKKKQNKKSVVSLKTRKTKSTLKSSKVRKKDSGPLAEVTVNPEDVEITEEDLRTARNWLLKYLEPSSSTNTITCLLDTELDSVNRRKEFLECHVVCPVEAPSIVLDCSPCLRFGPTPLGVRSKLHALVTNISFFDVFLKMTTLNPSGPFACPVALETPMKFPRGGIDLPPEHTLNIPIVFQPDSPGEVLESFEVMSGDTILKLEAHGKGVVPSYVITPDREVLMVACPAGKKVDTNITIVNSCEASLSFSIRREYIKEGRFLPTPKQPPPSSPDKTIKSKGTRVKGKKPKGKQEFDIITPELKHCLEQEFVELSTFQAEPIFSLVSIKDQKITVPRGETKVVTVRFTPPAKYNSRPPTEGGRELDENESKGNKSKKKSKKGDKQGNVKEENKEKDDKRKTIFAAKYMITFAEITIAKEFIIIGSTKK